MPMLVRAAGRGFHRGMATRVLTTLGVRPFGRDGARSDQSPRGEFVLEVGVVDRGSHNAWDAEDRIHD